MSGGVASEAALVTKVWLAFRVGLSGGGLAKKDVEGGGMVMKN